MNFTRRDFLKISAAGAASAAILAGCGTKEDDTKTNDTPSTGDTNTNTTTPSTTTVVEQTTGNIEGEEASDQVDLVVVGIEHNSFSPAPFAGQATGRDYFVKRLYGNLLLAPSTMTPLEECLPYMAKSVTATTEDKLVWEAELFEGITDTEGNVITAEDIIFSYEKAYAEAEMSAIGQYIDKMEAIDDTHLRFTLKMYAANSTEAVFAGHRICVCSKKWYEGASDDDKLYRPACTGPYKLVSYTPGAELVIEARDDYWQKDEDRGIPGAANVKRIEYKVITEAAMRTIALQNAEVDATPIQVAELYHFYNNETKENEPGWNASLTRSRFDHYMLFNMDPGMSPLADDKNLRLAILHAVNCRDVYLAAGYDDSTAVVSAPLGHEGMGGFNTDWLTNKTWNYDIDKAKEYMAASNHPDGCTLRLLGRPEYQSMLALIANELLAINITVELNLYEQSLFNQYKNDSTQWDIIHDNKGYGMMGYLMYGFFDPSGYENGGVNFCKDETLYELAYDATTKNNEEAIEACYDYVYDLALGRALFNYFDVNVSQDGILKHQLTNCVLDPAAATYAEDYKSVGA